MKILNDSTVQRNDSVLGRTATPRQQRNKVLLLLLTLISALLPTAPVSAGVTDPLWDTDGPTVAYHQSATVVAQNAAPAHVVDETASIPFHQLGAAADQQSATTTLAIRASAAGAELQAVLQDLAGSLRADGLWLRSTTASDTSSTPFRIMATGMGRGLAAAQPLAANGAVQVTDDHARWLRPGLVEEYRVSTDGIRQDFVLSARPAGTAQLRLELAVSGATVRNASAGDGLNLQLADAGRAIAYSHLHVTDATGRTLPAQLQAIAADRITILVDDQGATWPLRVDPTFADADWVSMGGFRGTSHAVTALAVSNTDLYIGGNFTAVGDMPANYIAKWDGSGWSALGTGLNNSVTALAVSGNDLYVGGYFTSAGGVSAINIAKWNGSTWSALGAGISGFISSLAVIGSDLYVGGLFDSAGGVYSHSIARWNGSAWSDLDGGVDVVGSVSALAVSGGDLYVGGQFSSAGDVSANNLARWNGSAWSALGTGVEGVVKTLAASGGNLYVGGQFSRAGDVSANNLAKWNGSAWSALGTGVLGYISDLVVSDNVVSISGQFSLVGSVISSRIAQWDGNTWSALDMDIAGYDYVTTLATIGSDLYVGGSFITVGDVSASNVVRWNGSVWSALGANKGINSAVDALAVSGSDLYVGGLFSSVGSVPASRIAKWNGNVWSALGTGVDGSVYTLAVNGNDLYVGGLFSRAGGVNSRGIAKWNGTAWSALEAGVDGSVHTLAVSGSDLYVGGQFSNAGSVSATNIAKWNGSTWSALGTGVDNVALALAVSGSNLYVGGLFSNAGGVSASRIAKWNGSAWGALGVGVDGAVTALALNGSDLYVGGVFSSAGGLSASRIAKWNGSAWSALGTGIFGFGVVNDMVMNGSDLYVGGQFSSAGGVSATNIAKWNGSAWSALGAGVDGAVTALAVSGSNLYAGGLFSSAGGKVSAYLAKAVLPPLPPATITIVLDAQPDLPTNLGFSGSLGAFLLDNPATDDGDAYSNSRTFTVAPGRYTVRRNNQVGWFTMAIGCTPASGAAVDLAQRRTTLTVVAGDNLTCTFTEARAVTIRTRAFNDLVRRTPNLGKRNAGDPWLGGWTMSVFTAPTVMVASGVTTAIGGDVYQAQFANLRPGNYTVCATLPDGTWTLTTPTTIDLAYGQPCKPITLAPGEAATLLFGAYQAIMTASESFTPEAELITDADAIITLPYNPDEDETLTAEDGLLRFFLPLVNQ